MTKLFVGLIIGMLISIGSASANLIHQEYGNSSFCAAGGAWSGAFCSSTYDGNYNTGGFCSDGYNNCILFSNYSLSSDYIFRYWTTKDTLGIRNDTLPQSCALADPIQLMVRSTSDLIFANCKVTWSCHNGSAWTVVRTTTSGVTHAKEIKEESIYYSLGKYYIFIRNETDFATPLYADIEITNGTTTLSYDNVTEKSINIHQITGTITITATPMNELYEIKSYTDTIALGENKSHTFYLPLTSTGSYINLNIQDALGLEIDGAIITTSKRNGATYTEIDQSTTDETGAIIVFMETGISHKIDVTKTGYLDKTQYITATLSSYDITLSQSTTHLNDTTELTGLTIYQTPSQTVLRENDAEEFVVEITSNSTLDWWSVDYLQDGTSISGLTNYTADSNGGTNTTTLNTTNRNGTIVSRIQYQVEGYGPRTSETNYTIYKIEDSDFSLKNILTGIDAKNYGNYGGMVVGFLALIITILVMATIGFEYPLTTLIGMLVLGLFAYMEWLNINIYFLSLIGILAYLFIRRSV